MRVARKVNAREAAARMELMSVSVDGDAEGEIEEVEQGEVVS